MSRKKGVLFSYLLLIIEMISSLFYTPFLIRTLGQSEFGLFSLVGSITAYLMLLDMGVGNAVVRYMAKYRVINDKIQQRKFLGVTISFYAIVGMFVMIIGMYLNRNIPTIFGKGLTINELNKTQILFTITMINAAVTLMLSPFDKTIIAFEQFAISKLIAILKAILRVSISTVLLIFGGGAISIVLVNLSITLFFGAISILIVILRLNLIPKFNGSDFSFIKEVIGYSIFIFIQMIATQINAMVDKVLLGVMTSSVIVGVYSVGAQISYYFESIASSINGVLMPGVVRLVESNANSRRLLDEMVKVGRLLFMILGLIWVTFFMFGMSFIVLWAGNENSEGYLVAITLILPMVFSLSQSVGAQILWAKGKHKVQAILKIMVSFINIGLTILLIKWNPLIGASIGTAISLIVGDIIVLNIIFKKNIQISIIEYYSRLFKGILPSLFIVYLIGMLLKSMHLQGWLGLGINCSIISVIYMFLMWIFGMNVYEKSLVKSMKSAFQK